MKPIKFRIKNYKSIIDSGICFFEEGYTLFAGKNESGKTTILEALSDFDKRRTIESTTIPLGREQVEPEISIWFEITREEIENINEKNDYTIKNLKNKNLIKLTKVLDNREYLFECEFNAISSQSAEDYWEREVVPFILEINENVGEVAYLSYLREGGIENRTKLLNLILSEEGKIIGNLTEPINLSEVEREILTRMKYVSDSFQENMDVTNILVKKIIATYMPTFVFYSSFTDTFPDVIKVEDIKQSEFARDLEEISKFKISSIIEDNKQIQVNHQRSVNTEFTDIFKKYWTQDNIKLVVDKDGNNIHFWIEENEMMFKPSQRSQGQQWFLSFYIKVVARMQEDVPNVILIDEPGLFLHAKAQKNMLKTLEEQFRHNLIVFSTHSPYLIEENKLNRIRLVEKENNETNIHSKTWARIKDTETLTPILTAIGLGIGDGISDRGRNNIICEGVEDVFYLRGFKKIVGSQLDINFINGDGSAKIHYIGRILEAWQCKVMYILDNDRAGQQSRKRLIDKEFVDSNNILMVSNKENYDTVDLLSNTDFKKYVLEDETIEYSIKNSEYMTKSKLDKPLHARRFLNNSAEIELDEESLGRINNLFDKIKMMLGT